MKLETWHRRVFHKLTSTPLWWENDYVETTCAVWSKPLFASCVALDQFNHAVSWYPAVTLWSKPLFPWFRAVHVALGQLIMTSLANNFTAPLILKNLARTCLLPTLNIISRWESVHRNNAGTICHCDVTIAGGQQLYRWRHNRSTFWIIGSSDGIKCGFTSIKPQESS